MTNLILQGVAKCTELLYSRDADALESYDTGPFATRGVVRRKAWETATVVLRGHKTINMIAIRTRRNRRTLVSLTTHNVPNSRHVEQKIEQMKGLLRTKRYYVANRADGENLHYYYIHEKGTTAENASHKNRIARLAYNPQERHFEIEAYAEHVGSVIKALFNGRKTPVPSTQLDLFDAVKPK